MRELWKLVNHSIIRHSIKISKIDIAYTNPVSNSDVGKTFRMEYVLQLFALGKRKIYICYANTNVLGAAMIVIKIAISLHCIILWWSTRQLFKAQDYLKYIKKIFAIKFFQRVEISLQEVGYKNFIDDI